MRKLTPTLFALALLPSSILLSPEPAVAGADTDREIKASWPAAELEAIRFEMSVGELEVTAGSKDGIEVEILAECKSDRRDCKAALEDLKISDRIRGDVLIIELEGYPKWGKGRIDIDAFVTIPADFDFDLDMGVGEVNIEGLEGNLDLDLGVGELTIDTQPEHLRSVSLDVGVGDAAIYGAAEPLEERRSFLVGSEVYWSDGKGDKRIKVDVGVGEAKVRLD